MSTVSRATIMIGAAGLALVAGPAIAATGFTGLNAGAIGTTSLLGMFGTATEAVFNEIAGKAAHDGLSHACNVLERRLKLLKAGSDLPENDALLRAVRLSHLFALEVLVEQTARLSVEDPANHAPSVLEPFTQQARKWLRQAKKSARSSGSRDRSGMDSALADLRQIIKTTESVDVAANIKKVAHAASQAAFDELSSAVQLRGIAIIPPDFNAIFWGGETQGPGWAKIACAIFTDFMNQDPRVRDIVIHRSLAQLGLKQDEFEERIRQTAIDTCSAIGDLGRDLSAIRERLEQIQVNIESRDTEIVGQCVESLFDSISFPEKLDSMVEQLRISFPAGLSWSQTAAQVKRRIEELEYPFVGRATDFVHLDSCLTRYSQGLIIVAAPAGTGKSALLANWATHRAVCGDLVARHFISNRFPQTQSPPATLGHLLSQVRAADNLVGAHTGGEAEQRDPLFQALRENRTDGRRLVIILDGLDEADQLIDPFVEAPGFAPGVFVVVSGRAELGVNPGYLRHWHQRIQDGVPGERIDLKGLSIEEVCLWLDEVIGYLTNAEMRDMASQLVITTSGLPIFLREVVSVLTEHLPSVPDS